MTENWHGYCIILLNNQIFSEVVLFADQCSRKRAQQLKKRTVVTLLDFPKNVKM